MAVVRRTVDDRTGKKREGKKEKGKKNSRWGMRARCKELVGRKEG